MGAGRLLGITLVVSMLVAVLYPVTVLASPKIRNDLATEVTSTTGLQAYVYGTGPKVTVDDFSSGTHAGTVDSTVGHLELAPAGSTGWVPSNGDWWDTAWRTRVCVDVENTGVVDLTEYQVPLYIDTAALAAAGWVQGDLGDIRVVDDTAELTHWVTSPVPATATLIWSQLESLDAGETKTICVYSNTATTTVTTADEVATFSYSSLVDTYRVVFPTQTSALSTVGYAPGTVKVDAAATQVVGTSATTLIGVGPASVVQADVPLATRGFGNGTETLIPMSFAGTDFVIPNFRQTQRACFVAPFVTATVVVDNLIDPPTTQVVGAGTTACVVKDVNTNPQHSVQISSDEPILAVSVANGGWDAIPLVPFTAEPHYGIHTHGIRIGYNNVGSVLLEFSDTRANRTAVGNPTDRYTYAGGSPQGTGPAVRATPIDANVNMSQTADGDGGESTAYFPTSELAATYRLPITADWVAVACPVNGVTITAGAASAVCAATGSKPGKAYFTNVVAGTKIASSDGSVFYAMYEANNSPDETNLLGPVHGRKRAYVEPVVATPDLPEGLYAPMGVWTSPPIPTPAGTNIFGTSDASVALPDDPSTTGQDTKVCWQVATAASALGPWPYHGPDGTTGTCFADLEAVNDAADGDTWVRVKVTLETTSPRYTPAVIQVCVGTDLEENSGFDSVGPLIGIPVKADRLLLWKLKAPPSLISWSSEVKVLRPAPPSGKWEFETPSVVIARSTVGVWSTTSSGTYTLPASQRVQVNYVAPSGTYDTKFAWQVTSPSGSVTVEHRLAGDIEIP